ncbi:hypothetical protein HY642_02960 [Candidatus Woesearchaeota archaeon]|nr:hypothetical protein [Candidatus Woesearchaeota archaeon]
MTRYAVLALIAVALVAIACAPTGKGGESPIQIIGLKQCGNGALNPGEECDDGNRRSGDGCSSQCRKEQPQPPTPPVCGNGVVDPGEDCDSGTVSRDRFDVTVATQASAARNPCCSSTCRFQEGGQQTCGVGACRITMPRCVNGQQVACAQGQQSAETCNGIDDDCDGSSDENLGSTSCGVGACRRTTQNCRDGQAQTCAPGTPTQEVCGNNRDDNCNGVPDSNEPQCQAQQAQPDCSPARYGCQPSIDEHGIPYVKVWWRSGGGPYFNRLYNTPCSGGFRTTYSCNPPSYGATQYCRSRVPC